MLRLLAPTSLALLLGLRVDQWGQRPGLLLLPPQKRAQLWAVIVHRAALSIHFAIQSPASPALFNPLPTLLLSV